jgi:predicted nucleic acid-binding protein
MWDCEQLAGKTVYLDANVFIYAFEGSHSLQLPSRAIARIFQMLATYQLSARTSALTRAEVLVHPLRH